MDRFLHFQYGCERHYPVRNRRRPPIPARQVVSESESSEEVFLPSAPPRSSSPALLPMECFEIPNRLLCPITFQLFEDPVVATDGHTYERAAILRCISSSQRSPLTRDPLISNQLVPTRLVKDMADEVRDSIRIARSMYKYQLDFHFEKREEIGPEDSSVQRKEFAVHWIKQQERLNDENCVLIYFGGENATKLAEIHRKLTIYPHLIRLYGQVRNKENEILFLQERNTKPSLNEFLNQNTPVNVLKRILSQIALTLIFLSEHSISYGRISKSFVYIQEGFENCEDLLIKLDKVSNYLLLDEEDLKNEDLAPEFRKSLIYTEKSDVYAFGRFVQQIYPTEDLTDEQKHFLYCCLDEEPTSRPNVSELNSFFVL